MAQSNANPEAEKTATQHTPPDQTTADLEDRLRRALADADNLRKRQQRQIADAMAEERARVAAAWLPIVDNLERALAHASEGHEYHEDHEGAVRRSAGADAHPHADTNADTDTDTDTDTDPIIVGVRAVRDQAVAVLSSLGYPRHDDTGVPFQPRVHEAVSVVPDADAPAGTVLEVLRPGYGEGVHQLRPAAVVVSGGSG